MRLISRLSTVQTIETGRSHALLCLYVSQHQPEETRWRCPESRPNNASDVKEAVGRHNPTKMASGTWDQAAWARGIWSHSQKETMRETRDFSRVVFFSFFLGSLEGSWSAGLYILGIHRGRVWGHEVGDRSRTSTGLLGLLWCLVSHLMRLHPGFPRPVLPVEKPRDQGSSQVTASSDQSPRAFFMQQDPEINTHHSHGAFSLWIK